MLKKLAVGFFRLLLAIVYRAYSVEGLNALMLVLPAKLIVPTLRRHGAGIGEAVEIHSPLLIHNADPRPGHHYANLRIGDECYFGRDVFLDLKDRLHFADRVTVSMRASFITHTDAGRSPVARRVPPRQAPIRIREGAYIGAGAIILQGVEIGEQAVIGAGAVVTASIPPRTVAVGVPAKIAQLAGCRDTAGS